MTTRAYFYILIEYNFNIICLFLQDYYQWALKISDNVRYCSPNLALNSLIIAQITQFHHFLKIHNETNHLPKQGQPASPQDSAYFPVSPINKAIPSRSDSKLLLPPVSLP